MAQRGILNGKLVVLLGGSGFLGNYVAQALLDRGARLRIASRNPERAFHLKPLANLGQIQFARCDVSDRASVDRCMAGADAAVNLVGSFTGDLDRLMGAAPGWMASAAAREGAAAFVHVSAIVPEAAEGEQSGYAAAKRLGEERVRNEHAASTIIRPSVLFGKNDHFINLFAGLIAMLPVLPVFGPEARLQPTYVDDVAEAVVRALEDPAKRAGKIYELAGPDTITMLELNRAIAAAQHRRRIFLPMPDGVTGLFAALPGTPMSSDQWLLLKQGSTPSGRLPGFSELGIAPKPLDLFLDRWMIRYRKHGRFAETVSG